MARMAATTRRRAQSSVLVQPSFSLARRLDAAQRVTGKSRAQIAREVLEIFLDAWLAGEMSHQKMVDAVRAQVLASLVSATEAPESASGEAVGYRAYLDTARRYLDLAEASEERVLAGEALAEGLARDRGREARQRGGDVETVLAHTRRRGLGLVVR